MGFRPLAGITVFRTQSNLCDFGTVCFSFRPLAGITVFRTLHMPSGRKLQRRVSVPWRGLRSFGLGPSWGCLPSQWISFRPLAGITVFRTGCGERTFPLRYGWFPSPGGDYGLSDWLGPVLMWGLGLGFRPLAGITVFRTETSTAQKIEQICVSVPWRGLRSFGRDDLQDVQESDGGVSVPWRGLRSFGHNGPPAA